MQTRNGLHLHESFGPDNRLRLETLSFRDRVVLSVVWLGIALSLLLGASVLVGLAWVLGFVAREVIRTMAR